VTSGKRTPLKPVPTAGMRPRPAAATFVGVEQNRTVTTDRSSIVLFCRRARAPMGVHASTLTATGLTPRGA
jgi:hypothetical protein